ncbi:UDP-glucose dehydrogenase family protein [Bacilliculturomica massiliensis]|uniref:UDP-glucose dehydrogenase family protein n=1 Tax=Bacilliculturomica massiliensis TaxID=1917867 RepID=UPI0010301B4D|nr:nucleotide sugar dehydrogenase [Bacilliculturomica massiliensis]
MVVTVFGLGFVGLTTAVGLAAKGNVVYGFDIDESRVKQYEQGKMPFYEPGLDDALNTVISKKLFLDVDLSVAIQESDIIYFCVGTPYGKNGEADLTYLFTAMEEALRCCGDEKFRVFVTKSTIPPSTTKEKIAEFLKEKGFEPGERIGLANNPEFLREGHCWDDFVHADRIVFGVQDKRSAAMLKELYQSFDVPVFCTNWNTAEYLKYLSNTLLATLISFSNEMSMVADAVGDIRVREAFQLLHMDKRWNDCNMASYVFPGCGYGGYCLPKDTNALFAVSKAKGFVPDILKHVIQTNEHMPEVMLERVKHAVPLDKPLCILGLSFKPGSDDVRDTPAAKLIDQILKSGYKEVAVYDPIANDEFRKNYGFPVKYLSSLEEAMSFGDHYIITTAWKEFEKLNELAKNRENLVVVDCRYMLDL